MNAKRNLIHWANLLYLLIVCASLLIAGNPTKGSSDRPQWMDPAVGLIVAQIGLILIPSLLFVWLTRQPFKATFKLKRLSFGGGIKCFLIGLMCWTVFVFLSNLTQALRMLISPARAGSATDIATGGGTPWLVFLGVALVAPLCEEALSRGVLLSDYEERVGVHAIWLVAILFALLHLSIEQVLGALLLGIVAGWVVYRTRSIWAGVLVHMGTNLLGGLLVLLMSLAVPGGVEGATQGAAQAGDLASVFWIGTLVWGGISLVMLVPLFFIMRSIGKIYPAPEWPEARLSLNALWSFLALMVAAMTYFVYRLSQGAL